ncbi:hypothetical protein FM114_14060 [Luteococcus japonicus LSP_Lj1]|uniref:Uncharacterized protein n=1 Tax=Luteococcus japonicus LSP_Lj1 TaxID=1255658 RepID=A0A1R4KFT1_9ACTN|nr:hypothetical protein FM114_14060 [Luteococcus japonicus LSP_Lj1]
MRQTLDVSRPTDCLDDLPGLFCGHGATFSRAAPMGRVPWGSRQV